MSHPFVRRFYLSWPYGCGSLTVVCAAPAPRKIEKIEVTVQHQASIPKALPPPADTREETNAPAKSSIAEAISQYFVEFRQQPERSFTNSFAGCVGRFIARLGQKNTLVLIKWPTHGQLRFCAKPARHVR